MNTRSFNFSYRITVTSNFTDALYPSPFCFLETLHDDKTLRTQQQKNSVVKTNEPLPFQHSQYYEECHGIFRVELYQLIQSIKQSEPLRPFFLQATALSLSLSLSLSVEILTSLQ